jgi:hypothetical protein
MLLSIPSGKGVFCPPSEIRRLSQSVPFHDAVVSKDRSRAKKLLREA